MIATKDEVISDQARRILKLRAQNKAYRRAMKQMRGVLYGIGGPLNDNCRQYNVEQLREWHKIEKALL